MISKIRWEKGTTNDRDDSKYTEDKKQDFPLCDMCGAIIRQQIDRVWNVRLAPNNTVVAVDHQQQ